MYMYIYFTIINKRTRVDMHVHVHVYYIIVSLPLVFRLYQLVPLVCHLSPGSLDLTCCQWTLSSALTNCQTGLSDNLRAHL